MSFDGIVTERCCDLLKARLSGGRINRVYQLSRYELLMQVRARQETVPVLFSCHPDHARFHITTLNYTKPDHPSPLAMRFRRCLEGAVIKDIAQLSYERVVVLTLLAHNEIGDAVTRYLYVEIMGRHSNIILADENQTIIEAMKRIDPAISRRVIQPKAKYELPPFLNKKDPLTLRSADDPLLYKEYAGISPVLARELCVSQDPAATIRDALKSNQLYLYDEEYHLVPLHHLHQPGRVLPLFEGLDTFYQRKDEKDRIKQYTSNLSHFVDERLKKQEQKLNKLEQELFESQNSEEFKIKGELLYSYENLVHKGMRSVTVENYYNQEMIRIELDERLDGKGNAKRYFARYQKARNAISYLQEQIAITKGEIEYFQTLQSQMDFVNLQDALEIKEELEKAGYLSQKKAPSKKKRTPQCLCVKGADGTLFYVGKNNLQNDYLTFKFAAKNDLWFHVKDAPGSHVIARCENPDEYVIRFGANLAALYSAARHSSSVAVNYTRVRQLKKAPGGYPGKVLLSHYKTIYIDPDDQGE